MLISAYTPTNNPSWLRDTYASLQNQTYQDWQWVLVPNSKDGSTSSIVDAIHSVVNGDPRVTVQPHSFTDNVGGLKQFACMKARGDILLELDHDDTLSSDCMEQIIKAQAAGGEFFYSDWVEFKEDSSCQVYDTAWGWENYSCLVDGKFCRAIKAFPPSARSICEIYFAPNHVRAWTRKAYENAGGYNTGMIVGDDHDLVCRTYLSGANFYYIDKPLYQYRLHSTNTVKLFNADIQKQQTENRNKYLHRLIKEEARRNNFKVLTLGQMEDMESDNLDFYGLKEAGWRLHYADDSIGLVKANDFLQLLPRSEVLKVIEEIYRVLVPGGWFLSATPSTDGRGAFQDFRHQSYWNENSWWYWTNRSANYHYYPTVTKDTPKFQAVRSWTDFISDWHKQNNISFCHADLCAFKGQRLPGFNENWN